MHTQQDTLSTGLSYSEDLFVTPTPKILGKTEKDSLYTLGYVLYGQEKYTEAIPFFTLLNLYEPSSARNYAALAACQKMTKAYEKAINSYATALLLEPDHIEYVLHIAECQIAGLYTDGAINTLNQLLAMDSSLKNAPEIKNQAKALLNLLNKKITH